MEDKKRCITGGNRRPNLVVLYSKGARGGLGAPDPFTVVSSTKLRCFINPDVCLILSNFDRMRGKMSKEVACPHNQRNRRSNGV